MICTEFGTKLFLYLWVLQFGALYREPCIYVYTYVYIYIIYIYIYIYIYMVNSNMYNTRFSSYFNAAFIMRDICHAKLSTAVSLYVNPVLHRI